MTHFTPHLKRLVLAIACATCGLHNAQAIESMPLQREKRGAPVLPDPTPEQREQGKQLLEKILRVVLTVPLTDAEAVLKGLGFQEFRRNAGPDWESVSTTDVDAATSLREGFSHITVKKLKVMPDPLGWSQFMLSGQLHDYTGACIHVDDAMARLKPLAQNVSFSLTISTQPNPFSPRQEVDRVGFRGLNHAQGRIDVISMGYENQFCAQYITIHYTPPAAGSQP